MAKVVVSSDFGFEAEFEQNGFSDAINRFEALRRVVEALVVEWNKYIPPDIEGPER